MQQRNWYEELNGDDDEPVRGELARRLQVSAEYQELQARISSLSGQLRSRLAPDDLQLWLDLDAAHVHRGDLRALAHYNIGVEHGLAMRAGAGETPAASVRLLVAALQRAVESL